MDRVDRVAERLTALEAAHGDAVAGVVGNETLAAQNERAAAPVSSAAIQRPTAGDRSQTVATNAEGLALSPERVSQLAYA